MVDTYLKSPEGSRVVIEELVEENHEIVGVRQNKKKLVPRRRLMLEYVEGSSSANKNTSNIETETDNAVGNNDNAVGNNDNPVVNNDNPVGNNDNPVGNNDNIEIETDNAKEGTCVDGFNFDDIDFSGVFLNNEGHKDNEGEVNCTNENEGNREAEDKGGSEDEGGSKADCSHQSENEGDDSEDSDYIVDNDYEVEEMEVDTRDFNVFVDEDEEYVGSRNSGIDDVRNEVDYENEIDDNLSYESFDSLTDESMEDFETRRSQKLREIRNKQKVSICITTLN
ncbi:5'-AMP-activated serine/threonine-protein kinase catalytic subunit alpha-like [Helianthus annuus]|uniref:5'-AMP-activated serine/threonine-protein kinase catalytic subunit alpha-like n=1 Tax=Helianthus annuus TaxID=4232 RepID=UPI000B8F7606|nr:5'-AMP-activated serine/threonine-protein kinase catalytic subunit alpha-like [Helianthus annuus]